MEGTQETTVTKEKNANEQTSCYSIHTFEIKIPLKYGNLNKYKIFLEDHCTYQTQRSALRNKSFYHACADKHYGHASHFACYNNEALYRAGISDISFIEHRLFGDNPYGSTVAASITFQVNPRILLGYPENKYICIVPSSELENIMPALANAFLPYGLDGDDLSMAMVKRLDICANITLESQASAERFLKLLRKGGTYKGLNAKYMPIDPKTHRRQHPPNEVRYIHQAVNRNCTIETLSIYLKHAQMQEKSTRYDAAEIERAKGQVRFELRINRRKLNYLTKKYQCGISAGLLEIAGTIGTDIFTVYLEGMYGKGEFVKYRKAVELIEQSDHRRATKDTMIRIVNRTRKTDLADAFRLLPPERIPWFRKYFQELGISPITLRDSWEEDKFENPVTYIQTQNVNER